MKQSKLSPLPMVNVIISKFKLPQQRHIEDVVTNPLFLSDFSSDLNFEMMALAIGKGDSFDCFIVSLAQKRQVVES